MKATTLRDLLDNLPSGAEILIAGRNTEGEDTFTSLEDVDLAYVRKSEFTYGSTNDVYFDEDIEDVSWQEFRGDFQTAVVLWSA